MVKIGVLQDPFTKIPPEGPLPQFTGQVYMNPAKPRPRSSAERHMNRINLPAETGRSIESKPLERVYIETPSFEQKANYAKPEKRNTESNPVLKTKEKYDTRINISSKVNNEDVTRMQGSLEVAQLSEKYLREELSV
jgi:hypothetical protein